MVRQIANLELDAAGTAWEISHALDHILAVLTKKLKADLLANRADPGSYTITLERTNVPK